MKQDPRLNRLTASISASSSTNSSGSLDLQSIAFGTVHRSGWHFGPPVWITFHLVYSLGAQVNRIVACTWPRLYPFAVYISPLAHLRSAYTIAMSVYTSPPTTWTFLHALRFSPPALQVSQLVLHVCPLALLVRSNSTAISSSLRFETMTLSSARLRKYPLTLHSCASRMQSRKDRAPTWKGGTDLFWFAY